MKHVIRTETGRGLGAVPREHLPDTVKITHVGSGTEYSLPLAWLPRQQSLVLVGDSGGQAGCTT